MLRLFGKRPQDAPQPAPYVPQAVLAGAGSDPGWELYECRDTGAVVRARCCEGSGAVNTDTERIPFAAGDYLVKPLGGGRRVVPAAQFEARFVRREG